MTATDSKIMSLIENTRKLYRYTSVYLVTDASYMPRHIGNCRWKEFERSFNERLRNLVISNSINSGLCTMDLRVAIMSITNWIKELRDNSVKHGEPLDDALVTLDILERLPNKKVMEEEVYEKIEYILNFVMDQWKQYIFEQEWKEFF